MSITTYGNAIKCDYIEYEIGGGYYTNTKYTWACKVCGRIWFSRAVAETCEKRGCVSQFETHSRYPTRCMGSITILNQTKCEKIIAILKRYEVKKRNDVFKLNKLDWKISVSEFQYIRKQLKK